MRVRMYHNLDEMWEGWGKNVVLSMRSEPFNAVRQIAALTSGRGAALRLLGWYGLRAAGGAGAGAAARGLGLVLSLAQVVPLLALKRRVDRWLGLAWGWTFTYPLGMLLFTLILLNSLRRLLTGQGVTWKGRAYKS